MAKTNVKETIGKYENFINDVLKEDLRILELKLQKVNSEVSNLTQLRHTLKVLTDKNVHPNGFKTQVEIGCNFFMEASVTDTSKVILDLGLNLFLEFTLDEACKYLEAKANAFEQKSKELCNKAAETKAHIKLMLFHISALQTQEMDIIKT